ncbi:M23 family metallopeptidase [Candidatus Micrarchaeota archaeon]|nr:M23 family metallopeptidase [Candidatus Micrarchaeota archaeon]
MEKSATGGLSLLLVSVFLFSASLQAATSASNAIPSCPNNQVCMFYGASLEKNTPGPSGTGFSTSKFVCPVNIPITGTFGAPYTNANGETRRRPGIEMRVPENTDVKSPAAGKVLETGFEQTGAGHFILIRHATNPNVESKIGYLQGPSTKRGGESVKAGETIGKSGKSGAALWPSVYFELTRATIPQIEVEDICKSTPVVSSSTVAPVKATVAGRVDCTQFSNNPVPESWSVVPGGRFGSQRAYPGGHSGFDYGGFNCGQPVKAVWAGQVRYYRNTAAGYGNEVSIKTACTDGTEKIVTYDHLQGFNAAVLDKGAVQAGDVIAYLGNTGGNYECHLHVNVFASPFRIQNGLDAGNVMNPEGLVRGGLQGHLA